MNRTEQANLNQLRREWTILSLMGVLFLLGLYLALQQSQSVRAPLVWLAMAGAMAIYQFASLWRLLPENRSAAGAPLMPRLGLGNRLSITRSVLNAALIGFLALPGPLSDGANWPVGWAAWLPGLLYLVSVILDYLDGYAARVRGEVTRLGEILDMNWDGAGMLFGSFLAVRYGQAPYPYVLVGLARYLFVFGLWLRRRKGLVTFDLPPRRFRRPIAGMQMGFVAIILLPVLSPPATQIAALLFMIPLLVSFVRDWFSVSGAIPAATKPERQAPGWSTLREILPLIVRAVVIALLVYVLLDPLRLDHLFVRLMIIAMLAIPALLLGVAGRVVALAVVIMSALVLQIAPLDVRFWLILLTGTILFMTGTGRFSLWKPEEWLIDHRAGE